MWNLTFGKNIECALEAILFSLGEEVEIEKLAEALEVHEDEIKEAVKVLSKRYEKENRGINIERGKTAVLQNCSLELIESWLCMELSRVFGGNL